MLVWFLSCLCSTVSLTLVREQRFIRIIYYYYYTVKAKCEHDRNARTPQTGVRNLTT